jgi:hypothetical protein
LEFSGNYYSSKNCSILSFQWHIIWILTTFEGISGILQNKWIQFLLTYSFSHQTLTLSVRWKHVIRSPCVRKKLSKWQFNHFLLLQRFITKAGINKKLFLFIFHNIWNDFFIFFLLGLSLKIDVITK